MRITMDVPEGVFFKAKTPEQVERDMKQAAAFFWVARGDAPPEALGELTAPSSPREEGTLFDLLALGPNVGQDSDFERPRDLGREPPEWGT